MSHKPFKTTVIKISQRHLDDRVMKSQIGYFTTRMLGGSRAGKWEIKSKLVSSLPPAADGTYRYECLLTIKRVARALASKEEYNHKISEMLRIGQQAANASGWNFLGKEASSDEMVVSSGSSGAADDILAAAGAERAFRSGESGQENDETGDDDQGSGGENDVPKEYATASLSVDLGNHFDHIYERDAQIAIVHSAIKAFVDSDFSNRFHCVLYGEPACGKTEILRSFSRMLGHDFVLELDATSTTKAGAERILLESKNLPPILICEEVEKTDETSLRWLLGLLDHRGEIRKTTHGGGLRKREIKMLCLATVNDIGLFKRVMDGALASRFSHKVWCPRPSKVVLQRILTREIAKMPGGDLRWVLPAIDWCVDVEDTNDPRRVTTVCLSGREKLLTGEYQRLLMDVRDQGTTAGIAAGIGPSYNMSGALDQIGRLEKQAAI